MSLVELLRSGFYRMYVLVLLLGAYLLNQLDRYMLAIVATPLAQDLKYGDIACLTNSSFSVDETKGIRCNATSEEVCLDVENSKGEHVCEWNYNGQGFQYDLLAGPIFILVYTLAGIFLGFAADLYNRKNLLGVCCIFWSVMTVLSGAVQKYWQLALVRFGLGMGEAGCTPFAASMIGDYFPENMRATALGFYNFGIYIGYSLSYAIGNFITNADILGQGWRWSFYISGIPGILLGFLILASVREPERGCQQSSRPEPSETPPLVKNDGIAHHQTAWVKFKAIMKCFVSPSLLMITLAGSIRNAAGYVWAYNTQLFYQSLGQTPQEIGRYMSWIPVVGGSMGVLVGGILADRVVTRYGPVARVLVIVISQITAAPFTFGALFLPLPWAYISLIPANILGEMWVGSTLAVVIELVPSNLRSSAVAVYLFIITNIAGAMNLAVSPIKDAFLSAGYPYQEAYKYALSVLYPGGFVMGALLYFLSMIVLHYELKRMRRQGYTGLPNTSSSSGPEDEEEDEPWETVQK